MPKIVWVGNQDWGKEYPEKPLSSNARQIKTPTNIFVSSIPYGIVPMLLVFAALLLKRYIYGEMPIDRRFIIVGIVLGMILIPVHEWLHAICSPKGSVTYYGVSLKKFAAFCVCNYPMSKRRYIVMSLLPMLLGVIPLILFLAFPVSWKITSAICWSAAMIGMLSPMPDYMDVHNIGKQVPKNAFIQSSNNGCFWFN